MLKRLSIILALAALLLFPRFAFAAQTDIEAEKQRMLEVFDYITQYQVSNPDAATIADNAIKGMLENLPDPYNAYFTPKEYDAFMEGLSGSFSGVGMYLEEKDDHVVVQAPIEGSPAYNAGLKPGDAIMKVDGENVSDMPMETVVAKIRGIAGTQVRISVLRNENGLEMAKEFIVTRQVIQLPLVTSKMLPGQIGYLKLHTFSEQSEVQFKTELDKLKEQGMKGFILDLSDNPGGLLDTAVNLASIFIPEGPILQVEDKSGSTGSYTVFGGEKWTLPMVTIINKGSASASEILTGALKDYGISTIVGEKSFGKGSVQGLFDLESGGVVKLTIQEYFSPKNNKIDGVGITPDIVVDQFPLQLQTALRVLGGTNTLKLDPSGLVFVNDEKYQGDRPMALQKDGQWFVAIRAVQNLFGGELDWNAEQQYAFYKLKGGQQFIKAGVNENFFLQDGQNYISLNQLLKTFKDVFTWEGSTLKLKP